MEKDFGKESERDRYILEPYGVLKIRVRNGSISSHTFSSATILLLCEYCPLYY